MSSFKTLRKDFLAIAQKLEDAQRALDALSSGPTPKPKLSRNFKTRTDADRIVILKNIRKLVIEGASVDRACVKAGISGYTYYSDAWKTLRATLAAGPVKAATAPAPAGRHLQAVPSRGPIDELIAELYTLAKRQLDAGNTKLSAELIALTDLAKKALPAMKMAA